MPEKEASLRHSLLERESIKGKPTLIPQLAFVGPDSLQKPFLLNINSFAPASPLHCEGGRADSVTPIGTGGKWGPERLRKACTKVAELKVVEEI